MYKKEKVGTLKIHIHILYLRIIHMINRPRGTQDFINMDMFDYVVDAMRIFLERSGFKHIQTPIIESVDLFKRSLGLHTDVVGKEMFTIQPHGADADQSLLCLRPEMTASVVRAFIEHSIDQLPWRVFSIGPVFRHERPQKGRYRQFHQVTIELIGGQSIGYDAQLIYILNYIFGTVLGLSCYELQLNFLGCLEDRVLYKQRMQDFLSEHQGAICQTCVVRKDANTLRVFDCKSTTCQELYKNAPVLTDHLCESCNAEWSFLKDYLDILKVAFIHKPTLVRGLDYYNKTAFEFVSTNLGAQSAFCGGGRYDGLVGQLSQKHSQPAVGAGIGIERVLLLLELEQKKADVALQKPLIVCIPLDACYIPTILSIGQKLLACNVQVELLLDSSLKNGMKKASKIMATHVVLIGKEEAEKGMVMVKDMKTGQQKQVEINIAIKQFSV